MFLTIDPKENNQTRDPWSRFHQNTGRTRPTFDSQDQIVKRLQKQ